MITARPPLRMLAEISRAQLRIERWPAAVQSHSGVRYEFGTAPRISNEAAAFAFCYSYSYAQYIFSRNDRRPKQYSFVSGHETRPTGQELNQMHVLGMLAAGWDSGLPVHVINLGVTTTPLWQCAIRRFDSDGGVMTTGSHNPLEWNGFKYSSGNRDPKGDGLNQYGSLLSGPKMAEVIQIAQGNIARMKYGSSTPLLRSSISAGAKPGLVVGIFDPRSVSAVFEAALQAYIKEIRQILRLDGSLPGKIVNAVVDPCGGAASIVTKRVIQEVLGVSVAAINDTPGVFPHSIEPIENALDDAAAAVIEHRASLAEVFDCDADRVNSVLADPEMGVIRLHPQEVAAINAASFIGWIRANAEKYPEANGKKMSMATHNATSSRQHVFCRWLGMDVSEVEVGEINVVTRMRQLEEEGFFTPAGTEGYSGGTVLRGTGVRDGTLITILQMLSASDPRVSFYLHRALRRSPSAAGPNLFGIRGLLPPYTSLQWQLQMPAVCGLTHDVMKDRIEAGFAGLLSGSDDQGYSVQGVQGRFEGVSFQNAELTTVRRGRHSRTPGADGGFKIVLSSGPHAHSIMIRGSKTGPEVRALADSPDAGTALQLKEVLDRLFAKAVGR